LLKDNPAILKEMDGPRRNDDDFKEADEFYDCAEESGSSLATSMVQTNREGVQKMES